MSKKLKFEGEPSPKNTTAGKRKKPRKQGDLEPDIPDIQDTGNSIFMLLRDCHKSITGGKY